MINLWKVQIPGPQSQRFWEQIWCGNPEVCSLIDKQPFPCQMTHSENVSIQHLLTTYSVPGSETIDMKETKLVLKVNTETKNYNVTVILVPTSCFGKTKSTLGEESWEKWCLTWVLKKEHQLIKMTGKQGGRGVWGREMGTCIVTHTKRTRSTRIPAQALGRYHWFVFCSHIYLSSALAHSKHMSVRLYSVTVFMWGVVRLGMARSGIYRMPSTK